MMKILLAPLVLLTVALGAASCGYSSKDNDLIGQVKRVKAVTPIICGDYTEADISLGVIRNGVGSMSHEDVLVYVPNAKDRDTLIQANKTGALVDINYDQVRLSICKPDHWVTSVSIVPDGPGSGSAAEAKQ